jgi:hypothetical protein
MKINADTKDLWLPALESGEYKQASNKLYDGEGGYCCLGVLCTVKGAHRQEIMEDAEDEDGDPIEVGSGEFEYMLNGDRVDDGSDMLEDTFADTMGISRQHQDLLTSLNDGTTASVHENNPLIEVWRKVATSERDSSEANKRYFEMRKHTFPEIAQIIREHF